MLVMADSFKAFQGLYSKKRASSANDRIAEAVLRRYNLMGSRLLPRYDAIKSKHMRVARDSIGTRKFLKKENPIQAAF